MEYLTDIVIEIVTLGLAIDFVEEEPGRLN